MFIVIVLVLDYICIVITSSLIVSSCKERELREYTRAAVDVEIGEMSKGEVPVEMAGYS